MDQHDIFNRLFREIGDNFTQWDDIINTISFDDVTKLSETALSKIYKPLFKDDNMYKKYILLLYLIKMKKNGLPNSLNIYTILINPFFKENQLVYFRVYGWGESDLKQNIKDFNHFTIEFKIGTLPYYLIVSHAEGYAQLEYSDSSKFWDGTGNVIQYGNGWNGGVILDGRLCGNFYEIIIIVLAHFTYWDVICKSKSQYPENCNGTVGTLLWNLSPVKSKWRKQINNTFFRDRLQPLNLKEKPLHMILSKCPLSETLTDRVALPPPPPHSRSPLLPPPPRSPRSRSPPPPPPPPPPRPSRSRRSPQPRPSRSRRSPQPRPSRSRSPQPRPSRSRSRSRFRHRPSPRPRPSR